MKLSHWTGWKGSRILCSAVAAALVVPMGAPSVFAVARLETNEMRPRATSESGSVRQELERELGAPPSAQAAEQGAVVTAQGRVPTIDILAQRVTHLAGAQTGQVYTGAAIKAGATGLIAGHSETRPGSPTPIRDTDKDVNAQITSGIEQGVQTIILAVGETKEATTPTTLQGRDSLLSRQVGAGLRGLTAEQLFGRLIIAYEPRWAIVGSGTGRPANPEYAQSAHRAIRRVLRARFGDALARSTRIIYGGAATADNAANYLGQEDIDGLLPGGASTSTAKFVPIVETAQRLSAEKTARTGRVFYIAGNQKTNTVAEDPAVFAQALAGIDPQLVQVGIAPTLPAIRDWRQAFAATDEKGAVSTALAAPLRDFLQAHASVAQLAKETTEIRDEPRLWDDVLPALTRAALAPADPDLSHAVWHLLWRIGRAVQPTKFATTVKSVVQSDTELMDKVPDADAVVRSMLSDEHASQPTSQRFENVRTLYAAVQPYVERYIDEADGQTRLRPRPNLNQGERAGLEALVGELQAHEALFTPDEDRTWVLAEVAGEGEAGKVRKAPSLELARVLAEADATFAVNPSPTPIADPGKQHTAAIAVLLDAEGFRGIGMKRKGEADDQAQFISLALQADRGVPGDVKFSEGEQDAAQGELPSGKFLTPGTPIVMNAFGAPESFGEDVVEGTNATATNNNGVPRAKVAHMISGGTSIRFSGAGVDALGGLPDGHVHQLFARVPPEHRERMQKRIEQFMLTHNPVEPYDEVKGVLGEIAEANSTDLNHLEVVLLTGSDRPRETANLNALKRIKRGYPGFTVTEISDGTVVPGMLAAMGRKQGKHVVLFTTGKRAEAAFNLVAARTQQAQGAIAAVVILGDLAFKTEQGRPVVNLARRYAHSEESQRRIRKVQPADRAEVLLNGTRALTPNDVGGPVQATMSLTTDNGWFNLPGIQRVGDGRSRVVTLRFSDPEGNGSGWHSIDVDDENPADLKRQVARGTFALQEPAAADPDVVDSDGTLLALMQDAERSHTMLVNASVSTQTPGFFIAWERALERFRRLRGLRTREEAAQASAVKVAVVAQPATMRTTGDGEKVSAEVTLLIAAGSSSTFQTLAEEVARPQYSGGEGLKTYARVQSSSLPGKDRLTITFSGGERAVRAAEEFARKPQVAVGVQAWVDSPDYLSAYAADFAKDMNTASKTATQLTPGVFNVVRVPEDKPVAVAIGPKAWLDTVPQATAKVAYEPAAEPTMVRPSASVLHAGAEAVTAAAQGRQPDPKVLAKLDVFDDAGLLTPKELSIEGAAQEAVDGYRTYQQTMRKTGVGG